jgi:predicted dehydrogenase
MKKVRIGIIGCGGIAKQKHFPALSEYPGLCEMVAFCDIIEERAKDACEKYGVPGARYYTDYKELLKDPTIDTVHVLTPNVAHSPITVAAFEAGKNVLCEKPMAHTTEAAQAMMDAWKKSGKKFTIGYQNRFRKDSTVLHEACEAGDLGEIYFAKAHAIRRRAVPTWGVFPNKELQGGGPLIDIGTHALDITLWCMNNYEVESVTGSVFHKLGDSELASQDNMFGPWDTKNFQTEDSAFGFVKMKNGAAIFLESAWAINMKKSREAACTLCGTKAGAEQIGSMSMEGGYDLEFNETRHGKLIETKFSDGGTIAFFQGEKAGPEFLEAKQWLNAILEDGEPLVKPEQAFIVTKILDHIYKSAESGKTVYFE